MLLVDPSHRVIYSFPRPFLFGREIFTIFFVLRRLAVLLLIEAAIYLGNGWPPVRQRFLFFQRQQLTHISVGTGISSNIDKSLILKKVTIAVKQTIEVNDRREMGHLSSRTETLWNSFINFIVSSEHLPSVQLKGYDAHQLNF
jgi:hypothetical protein